MMRKSGLIILLLAICLVGCGDQRILEELGFTQAASYDLLPDGKLDVSLSIPLAEPESKAKRQVLRTTSKSSKGSRIQMSRQTNLKLVSGQLRNAIFGLSLAKDGFWNHIDTLIRDPSISPQVKITVVNGNAGELLRKNYKQYPRTGKYIDKILEKESAGQSVPKVTLHRFARDYFDEGIDPVAPLIKDTGDHIAVDGIGLFRDDRYITRIPPEDTIFFAFLHGKFKQGEISIDLEGDRGSDKETVMFSSLISSRKVKVGRDRDGQWTVTFEIKIKGSVLEYTGPLDLSDDADRRKLENLISEHISDKCEEMVALMQRNKVDSLGVGVHVRNHMTYKEWKALQWNEALYPTIRVQCEVKAKINNYGKLR